MIGNRGFTKRPDRIIDVTGKPVQTGRTPTVVDSPALRAQALLDRPEFMQAVGAALVILGIVFWALMARYTLVLHVFAIPFGASLAPVIPAVSVGTGALWLLRKESEGRRLFVSLFAVLTGTSGLLGKRTWPWKPDFFDGGIAGTLLNAIPAPVDVILSLTALLAGLGFLFYPAVIALLVRYDLRRNPPPPPSPVDDGYLDDEELGQFEPVGGWRLPSADLLLHASPPAQLDIAPIQVKVESVLNRLQVPGAVIVGSHIGPSTIRFDLSVASAKDLESRERDLKLFTGEKHLRIQLPVGEGLAAIEVPSPERQIVSLGDTLRSLRFLGTPPLTVALGRDTQGKPVPIDIASGPHWLLAGETGAGKSYCMYALLTGILMRCSPEMARILLVDPKRAGFSIYRGVPHLLSSVINSAEDALAAFNAEIAEMDSRYEMIDAAGFDHLDDYNASRPPGDRLPYHLIFIDELAALIQASRVETENAIARLVALGRAAGVHVVAATQQPIVQVVTSIIKANLTGRIGFQVTSSANSAVAMGESGLGANHLLGAGDALFKPSGTHPQRVQVALVTRDEIRDIVACWAEQAPEIPTNGHANGHGNGNTKTQLPALGNGGAKDDPLWPAAQELAANHRELGVQVSISMLQRKLRSTDGKGIGFQRAARLRDRLEKEGLL